MRAPPAEGIEPDVGPVLTAGRANLQVQIAGEGAHPVACVLDQPYDVGELHRRGRDARRRTPSSSVDDENHTWHAAPRQSTPRSSLASPSESGHKRPF